MNNFITEHYDAIVTMARKICRSSPESEEVAHFAMSEFMEHERGQEIVSFHSSTSKYHTVYRQKGRMHELPEWHENWQDTDEYDLDQDIATEAIQGILEDMKAESIELWFRSTLFEMYVKLPNYSELARQTQIPRTSISKAVEEARSYIKLTLNNNNIDFERKTVQIVIDEDTYLKLDRLMMIEAIENGTRMSNLSQWVRDLIEDTVNYQLNKKKLDNWKPELLKALKDK